MIKTQPITAKKPTTPKRVREIEALWMQDIVDNMEKAFGHTVKTWKRKPYFQKQVEATNSAVIGRVFTDNLIYKFVSGGTRKNYPIPVAPRNKVLRFREGYVAKTLPGVLRAKQGGPQGGYRYVNVKNKTITHPGIKAREFPKAVAKLTERYVRAKTGKLGLALKRELQ